MLKTKNEQFMEYVLFNSENNAKFDLQFKYAKY